MDLRKGINKGRLGRIIRDGFFKNIVMVAGGTAVAQIVNILITPIITRMYSPEEYGVLTMYTAVLSIVSIVASLKYEMAIVVEKDDKKAINIVVLSISILLVFVAITTVILGIKGEQFLSIFNAKELMKFRYLIPVGILFMGMYNIVVQWTFRERNFKALSRTKISQTIGQNLTRISLGIFNIGSVGLIVSSIIGQSAGITTIAKSLVKTMVKNINAVKVRDMISCAKRYRKFALITTPSQFLNTAGLQVPTLLITYLYGADIIGFYGLANSIVSLPMTLVGGAIGDVFYGEVASIGKDNPQKVKDLSNKLFKQLVLIGMIPLGVLVIAAPMLFEVVFGSEWKVAGNYAKILAFIVFARLIFTPVSRIYSIFERQKEEFYLDVLRVIFMSIAFFVGYVFKLNSYITISLYAIGMCIIYLITFIGAHRILNQEIAARTPTH